MSVLFAISGTYDGESIWYPINSELRNEHLSIIDMRSAIEFRIGWKGKKVYAIQLLSSGCWLHELILLSDSYKRAGYAAFSIFIPNNKHVSGRSVKQLLDNAVAEYEKKCTDGCTIGIMDWQNFVKTHIPLDGLVVDSKSNQSRFTVGDNLNAPFAVVDNVADADVEKFFDNPFFREFLECPLIDCLKAVAVGIVVVHQIYDVVLDFAPLLIRHLDTVLEIIHKFCILLDEGPAVNALDLTDRLLDGGVALGRVHHCERESHLRFVDWHAVVPGDFRAIESLISEVLEQTHQRVFVTFFSEHI